MKAFILKQETNYKQPLRPVELYEEFEKNSKKSVEEIKLLPAEEAMEIYKKTKDTYQIMFEQFLENDREHFIDILLAEQSDAKWNTILEKMVETLKLNEIGKEEFKKFVFKIKKLAENEAFRRSFKYDKEAEEKRIKLIEAYESSVKGKIEKKLIELYKDYDIPLIVALTTSAGLAVILFTAFLIALVRSRENKIEYYKKQFSK